VGGIRGEGAPPPSSSPEHYYDAMATVIAEIHRILRPGKHMALYVSDSFRKGHPFMPIGFELFSLMRRHFEPIDIIAVVRHNQKLERGNWKAAAEEGNFFLRGFNYLFLMRKPPEARGPKR
jgi:DNA modification methylase